MNQNNRPLSWTTLEEAQQLVDAGLPVETADMYWAPDADTVVPTPYITKTDNETLIPAYKGAIPCWSLGALMQLLPRTIEQDYDLLINLEFRVMYRHPFSKDVKLMCSSTLLIENVKDAIIWFKKKQINMIDKNSYVEQPSEALEEEFTNYCVHGNIRNPNFEGPFGYDDIRKTAIHFAQWQKEQLINKACEWLKENIYNRVYKCNDGLGFPTAAFLEEFKKAMEDK